MVDKKFKSLRDKLPAHCYKLIARNAAGISALQARLVFYGEITDPEKVDQVIRSARNLARTIARQKQAAMGVKKVAKRRQTKPTV